MDSDKSALFFTIWVEANAANACLQPFLILSLEKIMNYRSCNPDMVNTLVFVFYVSLSKHSLLLNCKLKVLFQKILLTTQQCLKLKKNNYLFY